MSEKSERIKDKIRDSVEKKFDKLHQIADVVTAPLAPVDGVIHGTARGVFNWLTDNHPGKEVGCPNYKTPDQHGGCATPTPASQSFTENQGIQAGGNAINNNLQGAKFTK